MLAASLVLAAACGNKEGGDKTATKIVGDWHLVQMTDMPASDLPQVYITFTAEKTFELYQKLGEGRFRKYDGNYTLTGKTLAGTYSDGTAWGSEYTVSFEEDMLNLTAVGTEEVCTYKSQSISASDKNNAIVTKAYEGDVVPFL